MSTHRLWSTIVALAFVAAWTSTATAGVVMTAKSFFCGGTGPENARVTVSERDSILTFKFTALGLTPFESVSCGYRCAELGTDAFGPCGSINQSGRWSGQIVLPKPGLCWGLVPFFNTGSNGSCYPSAFP